MAAWFAASVPAAWADRHVFVGSRDEGTAGNLLVTSDGAHLYVPRDLGGFGPFSTVQVFARNVTNGTLSLLEEMPSNNPLAVAVSPNGAHVYAVIGGPPSVEVYSRNVGTGLLTLVETEMGGGGSSAAFSPDGKHLYVGSSGPNQLIVFSRNVTTGDLTYVETQTDGVGGVDGLLDVQGVAVSPDGAHVYATGNGDDELAIFSRNGLTGALTFLGTVALSNPWGVSLSPDGVYLYAGGTNVTAWARNPGTGALSLIDSEPGARDVQVSPDGTHVYGQDALGEGGLFVFERDAGTGLLSSGESLTAGVNGVTLAGGYIAVSPDSRDIYMGRGVAHFRRVMLSCSAAPAAGCFGPTQPGTGSLKLADNADDAKDALTWTWTCGQAVTLTDLGNPVDPVTDYALCLYDASGGGTLLAELLAPAGPGCGKGSEGTSSCWKAAPSMSPTKVSYRRKTPRTPTGSARCGLRPAWRASPAPR